MIVDWGQILRDYGVAMSNGLVAFGEAAFRNLPSFEKARRALRRGLQRFAVYSVRGCSRSFRLHDFFPSNEQRAAWVETSEGSTTTRWCNFRVRRQPPKGHPLNAVQIAERVIA
jgi:hypothetical protein